MPITPGVAPASGTDRALPLLTEVGVAIPEVPAGPIPAFARFGHAHFRAPLLETAEGLPQAETEADREERRSSGAGKGRQPFDI